METQPVEQHGVEQSAVKQPKAEEQSLKGTFVSVMILGALIIASWAGVFYLFMSRK